MRNKNRNCLARAEYLLQEPRQSRFYGVLLSAVMSGSGGQSSGQEQLYLWVVDIILPLGRQLQSLPAYPDTFL